ncbi:2-octaprenyl-6-methoxyphenyl hydroxylase [Idiomarina sp. OT37-5b]|uniref:2-octaprenyl-6-methoxyphenyl hydroxylase n=1 Tax=Idiomarina sp. OT37-5b TaxID=2100422 RepID=UPI000CF90F64|nr:2-octaprenyl-6-methoxyphenyl hydroxylase [Idiomarina sp. OT37-5b]AVJ56747.1 2-octaprenyl-6-methoxyphenyl hydroxylase [Idiomarina sp. OT37-5b]
MDAKVVIAGGSLVGALTTLMLAQQRPDWPIVVVEPRDSGPPNDKRIIALAAASAKRLEQLGVLGAAQTQTPIEHIHISDRGHLGAMELHAAAENVAALGVVVPAAELLQTLFERCQQLANVRWLSGCRVTAIEQKSDSVAVSISDGRTIEAQLLAGADGQNSYVRETLRLASSVEDYNQVGCIATLTLDRPLQGWAYERFTEDGPIALLPMPKQQASLVWTFKGEVADDVKSWHDDYFIDACQRAFGYRAGAITATSERFFYPLQLRRAHRSIHHRCVILGNASHALHPIAGQGFNLGLRDVETLVEVLSGVDDAGAFAALNEYHRRREQDYNAIINLTDLLVRGFSNRYWPMVVPRNLALLGLHHCGPLKSAFARLTMGMRA